MTRDDLPKRIAAMIREDDLGCWLWMGAPTRQGYGKTNYDGRTHQAHRLVYEFLVGPIPDGLSLDHRCRVRACVNPSHLVPCTNKANLLAPGSLSPAALNKAKTHCPSGHALDGANLYLRPGGWRACRQCRREARQRWIDNNTSR